MVWTKNFDKFFSRSQLYDVIAHRKLGVLGLSWDFWAKSVSELQLEVEQIRLRTSHVCILYDSADFIVTIESWNQSFRYSKTRTDLST